MEYNHTCIESITAALPENRITSAEIEQRLAPLYERLRLPEGRLELMSGIRERRHWDKGTMPSQAAAKAGEKAIRQAQMSKDKIDALVNCSVSRDFVEPATSTIVHGLLGLPEHTLNFDISNACLGFLSGMVIIANMIENGQIKRGLLVAGENGRPLMENTIQNLNQDTSLRRPDTKSMFASLTIGSAAAAAVMCHSSISQYRHRLLGGSHLCDTQYSHLCQGNNDTGMGDDSRALMNTDSEELLIQGVGVARRNWRKFKKQLGWNNQSPALVCTHQVGRAHRQRLYNELQIELEKDFATVEHLGNCGSASLPVTLALAIEDENRVQTGDKIALLGIGSGINCQMLGLQW